MRKADSRTSGCMRNVRRGAPSSRVEAARSGSRKRRSNPSTNTPAAPAAKRRELRVRAETSHPGVAPTRSDGPAAISALPATRLKQVLFGHGGDGQALHGARHGFTDFK